MVKVRPLRWIASAGVVVAAGANCFAPVRADTPPVQLDVWAWGRNSTGELAGVPPSHTIPWPAHQPKDWVAVSAGDQHALALTASGEVWAWGLNTSGQLGDGTNNGSMLPVQVQGLIGATLIAAGAGHSLAYRASDGTLWAWGSNTNGQLGQDPTATTSSRTPVQVKGLPATLTAIAAGASHSLALDAGGNVYAWGENGEGELGLGDLDDRSTPTLVRLSGPASAIAAGSSHSLAVTASDGQAWAWGSNTFGQLGSGVQGTPGAGYPNPQPVVGVSGVDQVAAGGLHSLARTTDGHVWAWGYNTEGQVGNGDFTPANIGVLSAGLLTGIDGVSRIAAGGLSSIALRSNGEVWAWGTNQFGTCGVNDRVDRHVPAKVLGISNATAVSIGGKFALAVAPARTSSKLVVLGNPSVDSPAPQTHPAVQTLDAVGDVVALSAGWHHFLAIDGSHRVWSWGDDSFGQLGTSSAASDPPARIDLPLDGAVGFVQVAARANDSFALRSDGAVFSWGDNAYGQLGTGSSDATGAPTEIPGLSGIQAIAAGERHALALDQNSQVWAWGQNLHGELGAAPSNTPTTTPSQISSLFGTTEIAAGGYHNLALDLTGQVYAWGSAFMGQLGPEQVVDSPTPVLVSAVGRVSSVSAGRFHSLAVLAGGAMSAFGSGAFSQLGRAGVSNISPATPSLSAPVQLVSAGEYHSLALGYDGTVYGWGDDSQGQLGLDDLVLPHSVGQPAASTEKPAVLAAGGLTFSVLALP